MAESEELIKIDIVDFNALKQKNPTKYKEFLSDYTNKFHVYSALNKEYEKLMPTLDDTLELINKKKSDSDSDVEFDNNLKKYAAILDKAEQLLIKVEQAKNELDSYYQEIKFFISYSHLPNYEVKKAYLADWEKIATTTIESIKHYEYLTNKQRENFIKSFVTNCINKIKTDELINQTTQQLLNELQNKCITLITNQFNNQHNSELTDLIKTALSPKENKIKPLKSNQIEFIKVAIGEQLFEELMNKYQLNTKNFTMDDFRALIIGMLLPTDQEWENNHFIKNLKNLYQAKTAQDLREKIINSSGETLTNTFEKMSNSPKAHGSLLFGVKEFLMPYAKKLSKLVLPQADFLLDYTLLLLSWVPKANQALERDMGTVVALANVNNWCKENQGELQKAASNEYIFNKLSLALLREGVTVPIVEVNGEINFYTVKKLVEQPGVNGIALVPKDPLKSLSIKIVFQSDANLMKEMLDLENYTTMQAFNRHKLEIVNNLNKIINEFKQNTSPEQFENLSLNIGGHGRGGALAQQLINELIISKLAKNCNKQFDQAFDEKLDAVINNKCAYELLNHEQFPESVSQHNILHRYLYSRNDWYTTLEDIKDNPLKLEAHKTKIKEDFMKYLQNSIPETVAIHDFSLTTVNSGGVPLETRNNFIIALTMLKELFQNIDKVNVNCNKIMVDGNLMQLTGDTDLAASVDPEIMPISLIKITPKIDSRMSGANKIAEGITKIMLYNWMLEFGEVLFDIHSFLKNYNKLDPKNEFGKIAKESLDLKAKEIPEEQKKILSELLNIATKSHVATFFDKADLELFNFAIADNFITNSQQKNLEVDLDLELSNKLPIPLKEYYHKIQDLFTTGNLRNLQYLQHLTSYLINSLITAPDVLLSEKIQTFITNAINFYKVADKLNTIRKEHNPMIFTKMDTTTEEKSPTLPFSPKKPS